MIAAELMVDVIIRTSVSGKGGLVEETSDWRGEHWSLSLIPS